MTGSASPCALQQAADVAQIGKPAPPVATTPPSHSASAAANDCRSSVSVSPPIIAPANSPSGFSARRICGQHTRQIIGKLKRQRRDRKLERFRLQAGRVSR